MTLDERLHAISIDKPQSKVPPKTDTLVTLLTQGLQSHDKKILNVSSNVYFCHLPHMFTARIRRMGEGTVFSLFVSSHLDWGGGVPRPGLDGGEGVPWPGLDGEEGVPRPGLDGGGGVPQPGLDAGGGTLGYFLGQVWMGYPLTMTEWFTP